MPEYSFKHVKFIIDHKSNESPLQKIYKTPDGEMCGSP